MTYGNECGAITPRKNYLSGERKEVVTRFFYALIIFLPFFFVACKSERKAPANLVAKEHAKTLLQYNQQLVEEVYEKMKVYTDSSSLTYKETKSGLMIEVVGQTTKRTPTIEDKVAIDYSYRILQNGVTISDTEVGVVKALSIKGMREAVQLMGEGDSIHLVIPPHLAFGVKGDGNSIVPAAVLIAELHLVKIY